MCLGDFGLARYLIESSQPMTPQVVTLWYRPPEILLGSSKHSSAIDMWAFGCVVAELLEQKPLFPATTEIAQLGLIVDLIGIISQALDNSIESKMNSFICFRSTHLRDMARIRTIAV